MRSLKWFSWWEARILGPSRSSLRQAITQRHFLPMMVHKPYKLLLGLYKLGSISDYRELISRLLHFVKEDILRRVFMNGVQEDIQAEVSMHPLASLWDDGFSFASGRAECSNWEGWNDAQNKGSADSMASKGAHMELRRLLKERIAVRYAGAFEASSPPIKVIHEPSYESLKRKPHAARRGRRTARPRKVIWRMLSP